MAADARRSRYRLLVVVVQSSISIVLNFRFLKRRSEPGSLASPSQSSAKSVSKARTFLSAISMCASSSSFSALSAKLYAVRTMFLICRPLSSSRASLCRHSSSTQSRYTNGDAFEMKLFHRSRRDTYDRGWYLMARWIRDLNAGSKFPIRFVVRNRIPV